jgi:phospholipase C
LKGDLMFTFSNRSGKSISVAVVDNAYGEKPVNLKLTAGGRSQTVMTLAKSHNWYDVSVQIDQSDSVRRYAGHIETGKESVTDPFMGRS